MAELSDELARKLVELVGLGARRDAAFAALGVSTDESKRWLQRAVSGEEPYQRLMLQLDDAEKGADARGLIALLSASRDDWRAAIALMDQRRADAARLEQERRREAGMNRLRALGRVDGQRATKRLTEQRIDVLLETMIEGTYLTGQTDRELAELWGVSRQRVQNLAAEASRVLLRYSRENPEIGQMALAQAVQNWARLRVKAEALGTEKGFAVAQHSDELTLTYLGMKPAEKLDVSSRESFANWSDDELKEYLATGKRPKGK
ncbi:MAG: hypothetical protein ACOY0T_35680 [Myxococcota bacterium]